MPKNKHGNTLIFTQKKDGLNQSHSKAEWRYGSGNVFTPPVPEKDASEEQTIRQKEKENAKANVQHFVKQYYGDDKKVIMLESQYGKGISFINQEFFDQVSPDEHGHYVIKGDGAFTQRRDVVLLNKSGDAQSLIIESPLGVGIVVGSWHCVKKGILPYMFENFLSNNINPSDITLHIGPGLGNNSYDMGQSSLEELKRENPLFEEAFVPKSQHPLFKHKDKEKNQDKYVLDFIQLIKICCKPYGIRVNYSQSQNNFDREKWREVKQKAKAKKDANTLIQYYQNLPYFSARLYSRVNKAIKKLDTQNTLFGISLESNPSYAGTGRNLNMVTYNARNNGNKRSNVSSDERTVLEAKAFLGDDFETLSKRARKVKRS